MAKERSQNKDSMEVFVKTIKKSMEQIFTDSHVRIEKRLKNNGKELTGIIIAKKDAIIPMIYLDDFYEDYMDGVDYTDICNRICNIYRKAKENISNIEAKDVANFIDFESIKDKICFKLINKEKNQELLQNLPYMEYLDFAIIFLIVIDNKGGDLVSIKCDNALIEKWNLSDIRILYEIAKRNTAKMFPAIIVSLEDALYELVKDNEKLLQEFMKEKKKGVNPPLYIATNIYNNLGANIILYDGILKEFSKRVEGDFIILPSSIHELIFVPVSQDEDDEDVIKNINSIIKDVNQNVVLPEDRLSDHAYRYIAELDRVERV